jgi:hypothetical protein
MLISGMEDLTDRIERIAEWSKGNLPLEPDEAATVEMMIHSQIARGIQRGDFDMVPAKSLGDVGPCCLCGQAGDDDSNPVRNVWMLPVEVPPEAAPSGWGCYTCGLPRRGATAILCDRCVEGPGKFFVDDQSWRRLTQYCAGSHGRDRRPISELFGRQRWAHDMSKHSKDDRRHSMEDPII